MTTLLIDTQELIPDALVIGGTGLGVPGALIPARGENGASILYGDVDPGDEAKEFRLLAGQPTVPAGASLFIWENGEVEITNAVNGRYSIPYTLIVDGELVGEPTVATVLVGVSEVASDLPVSWSVAQQVSSDLALAWSVAQQVSADLPISYSVAQQVGADLSLSWAVAQQVSSDLTLTWDIEGAAQPPQVTRVSSDLTLTWAVAQQVGADLLVSWSVAKQVSSDLALSWAEDVVIPGDQTTVITQLMETVQILQAKLDAITAAGVVVMGDDGDFYIFRG